MAHWAHIPSNRTVLSSTHWINPKMHGNLEANEFVSYQLYLIIVCRSHSNENSCACWSPKGKQIVVAFPNGKLAQYKPDLKLAKTIPCTVQLLPVPFSPVAIQWLSTYQFAIVFVEEKEDAVQCML